MGWRYSSATTIDSTSREVPSSLLLVLQQAKTSDVNRNNSVILTSKVYTCTVASLIFMSIILRIMHMGNFLSTAQKHNRQNFEHNRQGPSFHHVGLKVGCCFLALRLTAMSLYNCWIFG